MNPKRVIGMMCEVLTTWLKQLRNLLKVNREKRIHYIRILKGLSCPTKHQEGKGCLGLGFKA